MWTTHRASPACNNGASQRRQATTHGSLAGRLDGTNEPGPTLTPPDRATAEDNGYLSASKIAIPQCHAIVLLAKAAHAERSILRLRISCSVAAFVCLGRGRSVRPC
jgi:hypothetical protein